MAPRPGVGHGYDGPMYCVSCNPRFTGATIADLHWSCFEWAQENPREGGE